MVEISAIIPSYNKLKTLPSVLERIDALPIAEKMDVVIVDDGSADGTFDFLNTSREKFKFRLIPLMHDHNYGKGAVLITGINYAAGKYIVIQDADLEYDPRRIVDLYRKLDSSEYEAVFGSRFLSSESETYSLFYLLGNKFLTFLTNLAFGLRVTDSYTCYKAFPSGIVKGLALSSSGFEIEAEISCKVAFRKYSYCEIPVTYKSRKRNINFRDAVSGVLKIIKLRAISLIMPI